MKTCWITHDARPGGRFVDDAEADKQQTQANKEGVRPGQNIEDIERGALDRLLFGKGEGRKGSKQHRRNLQHAQNVKSGFDPHSSTGSPEQDDFIIDPITNRRVARHPAPNVPKDDVDIPIKTVKDDILSKPLELYPDLDKYKPVMDKEPGQFEDLKPPYEDLDQYRSVVVDEITARFNEGEKAPYSDLDKYRAATDEAVSSREDSLPEYDDLDKYNAFRHNEPDGKPTGHQVKSVPNDVHHKYESFIEELQPGDFPQSTVEELRRKYDPAELKKYTAVRHLEPDGNPGPSAEELSKAYDPEELKKYEPVKWNEPDGNPTPSEDPRVAEGLTKDYDPDELAKYGPVKWHEPDGNPTPSEDARVAEGLTKTYSPEELAHYNKPVHWNEPDGQPLPSQDQRVAEELTKDYNDLDKYSRAYRWNEPDGKPTPSADSRVAEGLTKNYIDLDKYSGAYRWNEPDGKPAPTAEELSKNYADLGEYNHAYRWNEPNGKPAPTTEGFSEKYNDMGNYRPVKYQEADRVEKSNYREMLESLMKRHQTTSDAIDREASLAVKSAKAKASKVSRRMLTGNYVRDFPEDFEKSWPETISESQILAEEQHMDGGLEGAFGRPTPSRLQPALDRQPSGKAPVSEKGHDKICDGKSSSVDERARGAASREARSRSESTGEPTLYKILAYDPTMQEINSTLR